MGYRGKRILARWGTNKMTPEQLYEEITLTKQVDEIGLIIWKNSRGQIHRILGPAIEHENGDKEWYQNGVHHRENGPAVEYSDGSRAWFLYGQCHRENGPAIERTNGVKEWYQNGKRHREDGPAIIHTNGSKEYWKNGISCGKPYSN